ncbi:MAG TPA: DUF433 domain-containing protein [Pirellulales bacterium]|nr:DUF433 domain-containing protein [Pirellulales bacterium]
MQAAIIDRGRGPEIAGTRITVYDIMDYYKHGCAGPEIAAKFRLSCSQVEVAIDYIEAHKDEVQADYQKILDRHARGNPPELVAKAELSHAKFLAYVAERFRKQAAESNGAQDSE